MAEASFDPEEEWRQVNKGGWKRRVPLVVGLVCGALVASVMLAGLAWWGKSEQDRIDEVTARGGTIMCRHFSRGRTWSTSGPCREPSSFGFALVLVAVGGIGGFALGFRASGGRISGAYVRGLRELSN